MPDTKNKILIAVPLPEEIKAAVFNLDICSALSLDGFRGSFYHKYWDFINFDIIAAVQYFLFLFLEIFTLG